MADSAPAEQSVAAHHRSAMRRVRGSCASAHAPAHPFLHSRALLSNIFLFSALFLITPATCQSTTLLLLCKNSASETGCLAWRLEGAKITKKTLDLLRESQEIYGKTHCEIAYLKQFVPQGNLVLVSPLNDDKVLHCKMSKTRITSGFRSKRQSNFRLRGRYRGQTQSQYLSIDRGNGKDEGKAEAHSAADSSRAIVSGNSGMGQAQSQTVYDPSCEDCNSKSDQNSGGSIRGTNPTNSGNGLYSPDHSTNFEDRNSPGYPGRRNNNYNQNGNYPNPPDQPQNIVSHPGLAGNYPNGKGVINQQYPGNGNNKWSNGYQGGNPDTSNGNRPSLPINQGGRTLGQGGTLPGQGGNIPGSGGTLPGVGGIIPGQGGNIPGQGGTLPGVGGTIPGQGGNIPGHGGNIPGNGGTLPGQGGNIPGHGGIIPGNVGTFPSQGGNIPGHGGNVPGNGGTLPGQGGRIPGYGGNLPGNGGTLPGQGGNIPGYSGNIPGNGITLPGHGNMPGHGSTIPGIVGTLPGQGGKLPETGSIIPGQGGIGGTIPGQGGFTPGGALTLPGQGGTLPGQSINGLLPGQGGTQPGQGRYIPGQDTSQGGQFPDQGQGGMPIIQGGTNGQGGNVPNQGGLQGGPGSVPQNTGGTNIAQGGLPPLLQGGLTNYPTGSGISNTPRDNFGWPIVSELLRQKGVVCCFVPDGQSAIGSGNNILGPIGQDGNGATGATQGQNGYPGSNTYTANGGPGAGQNNVQYPGTSQSNLNTPTVPYATGTNNLQTPTGQYPGTGQTNLQQPSLYPSIGQTNVQSPTGGYPNTGQNNLQTPGNQYYPGTGQNNAQYPGSRPNNGQYPGTAQNYGHYPGSSQTSGQYPGSGRNTGQYPGPGQTSGQYPNSGQIAGQYPGSGQGSGQLSGSSQTSGQYPGSGSNTGQYPGSGQNSGQYPGSGSNNGQYTGSGQTSGQYPGSGANTGQYPGSSQNTGQYPGSGQGSAQYPGSGSTSGQYPGSNQNTGQYPGSGQTSGQYPGSGQTSGQYPGSGQTSGQYPGSGQTSGEYPGSGQGSGQYPGSGQGSGQYPGSGQGSGQYPGSGQGSGQYPGSGQGSGQYPGSGQGSGQYPESVQGSGQYPGSGQGSGQYPGSGQGSGQYPGSGQGSGQYPGSGQGSGQFPGSGQGSGQYPGTGQSSGQYPGTSQNQGQLPGSGQNQGQYPSSGGNNGYYPESGQSTGPNNGQYPANGQNGNGYRQGVDDQGNVIYNNENAGEPQNVLDPNSISSTLDDYDSQAQASVSQAVNGTTALASSKGGNEKGRAQTQVEGTYTGTGSFSANAEISDDNKAAQSHVTGSKKGASGSAEGRGRKNKSQASVKLGSETGSILTDAQSSADMHSSGSQVQGSVKGGMADAQAKGPGSTSSQAQIGFTPYKEEDKEKHDLLKTPFEGGGTASAQSNRRMGTSQSQLRGTFRYGISYNGAAQAGSSLDKDAVFSNLIPFDKIDVYDENNKNINVDISTTERATDATISWTEYSEESTTEKSSNSDSIENELSDHIHSDHHKINQSDVTTRPLNVDTPSVIPQTGNPSLGSRRSFHNNNYGGTTTNGADYEYPTDKEIPEEYDIDDGFGSDGADNTQIDQGEYANYDDTEVTHQSLQNPNKKKYEIRQTTGGNTQHIILGSLNNHDAKIIQKNSEHPDEKHVYQPGERVPGMGGYTIPAGFTGSVKSIASKENTFVVGSKYSPSQAQTVKLTPGTGKIKYLYPSNYGQNINPKDLRSLRNSKPDDNRYVSVSKSVTRDLDSENNIRKQYSHTYYTKSSSCGYFTFTCTMVSSAEGKKKVCKPKIPTNPDGTPMRC